MAQPQRHLTKLKSFAIELIMAHVLDTQGKGGSIEQRFRNFLLYIAQTGLADPISFPENSLPLGEVRRSCRHSRPCLRAPTM